MDTQKRYPSDLTHREWAQVCRVIPAPKPGGRPAKDDRREITNALLDITRAGCPWRMLPTDLPPWRLVSWYFLQWKKDGILDRLRDLLRGDLRVAAGRNRQPSAAILDTHSVKTTERGGRTALTPVRGLTAASGTSWWTPSACSWRSWGTPPTCRIATGRGWCSNRSVAASAGSA